jgi:lipopolysaccharide export system protein LptA
MSRTGYGVIVAAIVGLSSALTVTPSGAQSTPRDRCRTIDYEPRVKGRDLEITGRESPLGSGVYVTVISGGVTFICLPDGLRLSADSAEYHQGSEIVYLFGNVRYVEPGTTVNAQRITYWKNEERILAEQNVVAQLENGTRMTGPRAEYFRAVPGIRTRAQLRATERPRIVLVQADTSRPAPAGPGRAGAPGGRGAQPPVLSRQDSIARAATAATRARDTTIIDANTVFMDGDSLVYASGRVVVTRTDIVSSSDSLFLDRATERARFLRDPVIKGKGSRPFTLSGIVVELQSRMRRLERVLSLEKAKVVSDDLDITSDTLDLRIENDLLQRAVAWGKTSRARLVSPGQDMTADSVDIIMPGQRLREVRSIGKAMALSDPDSTKIKSAEKDWMSGDTIVARFDSVPPGDTTTKPRIRELRAQVAARAYYQIAPDDSASCVKINYNRGHEILVSFAAQAVRRVTVTDSVTADGVLAECAPTPPGTAPAAGPSRLPPPGSPPPGSPPAGPPSRPPPRPGEEPRSR